MRVSDGTTTFFTDHPQLLAALTPYDRDHNGELTPADFPGAPANTPEEQFDRVVSMAFRSAGVLPTDRQAEAAAQLFRLARRIDRLDRYALRLAATHIDEGGYTLEVDRSTWVDDVLPVMRRNGPLSPEQIGALPTELLSIIMTLTNHPELASTRIGQTDCGDTTGLIYHEAALPPELQRVVRRVTAQYLTSATWLLSYQTLACAGTNWWSDGDCPPGEPIALWRIPQLTAIDAGPHTDLHQIYCSVPERTGTVACFPGDTFVLTDNGTPLPLRTLAAMYDPHGLPWGIRPPLPLGRLRAQRPEPLHGPQQRLQQCDEREHCSPLQLGEGEQSTAPRIATVDEQTGQIAFQHPSAVLTHAVTSATLLDLTLRDATGVPTTLAVTDNHPLWVERGGERHWLVAGGLRDGDQLVLSDNAFAAVSTDETLTLRGAFDLYDVHFDGSTSAPNHNFLVSADGAHWFVAHNKL
ncbi:MAG: hypothetical protein HY696_05160 [Deltaproteobacteria bacterium]|nr:hypothetical protein [Deltaproteobacteria bacterium]